MPWDIRREGNAYSVVQRDNGKVVGRHATRASAERQQAALYATEDDEAKKSMNNLYEMLTPIEKAYHNALVSIVDEYGPFDKGTQSVWVGYEGPADNEKASIGVKCSNCSFYGEGGSCKIVSFLVEAEGYCRLAAIPDNLVNKGDIELGKGIGVGSMVSWNSSGGTATGKIKRIIRDGKYNVPNSDFTINGTKDDPAAVIEVYRDGKPSGVMVGHKLKTLRSAKSTTKSVWGGSFDPRGF